jgi:hypothetical protein
MKKRYDSYGDAETISIIGTCLETLGHALTLHFEYVRRPGPNRVRFYDLNRHAFMVITHMSMSHDMPVDLVRPLMLGFFAEILERNDDITIGVTEEMRAIWNTEAFRDTFGSLTELEYGNFNDVTTIQFDPAACRQWMVDNGIEFVQAPANKEG